MRLSRRALLLAAGAAPLGSRAAEPGTLVCPLAVAPALLIPGLSRTLETRLVGSKIYSGLCRFDAHGVAHPDLAARWDVSADGRTYVFHLRPDVIWHDSGAVTADDVVFSIDRLHRQLQPRLGLDRVVSVRAVDAGTVVVRLSAAFEPFLRQMDALSAPIVPRHVHDRPGFALDPRQTMPVGTGPFWMAEWLRLVRFEWFAGPRPSIAKIAFPVQPDPDARIALLERGQALLVGDAVTPAGDSVAGSQPADAMAGVRLNAANPALLDVQVRLGLACAIDRAAILRDVWLGRGRVAAAPGLSGSPDRAAGVVLPAYDPRAASEYFNRAGLRPDESGVRLRLAHLVPPGEPWRRLAVRLRTMLAHVGVDLAAEMVTQMQWSDRVAAGEYQTTSFLADQSGDFTLDLAAYVAELPSLAPLLTGTNDDSRADALAWAQAMLVAEATRVWLVEPALPVTRDRRLSLPGGVFADFATASLSSGLVSMNQ